MFNAESKKRKKKLGKHGELKKRKLSEYVVAVTQHHTAGELAGTGLIDTRYSCGSFIFILYLH